jgi:hypothetical protein
MTAILQKSLSGYKWNSSFFCCMLYLFLPLTPSPNMTHTLVWNCVSVFYLMVLILKDQYKFVGRDFILCSSATGEKSESLPHVFQPILHLDSHSQWASSLNSLKFLFAISPIKLVTASMKWVYALCNPVTYFLCQIDMWHTLIRALCTVCMLKVRRRFWHKF